MNLKRTLEALVLAGTIGLTGCDGGDVKLRYIEGTVRNESGTIVDKQRFENPTYVIQFETDDGETYTFTVLSSDQKLEALSLAIEKGTKIRMTEQSFYSHLNGTVGRIKDFELCVPKKY